MISFEGGGWCGSSAGLDQTLANCLSRAGTALGSSSSYQPTIVSASGILSDVADNPFRDWTIAHLKYCDGTGHQGYRKEPISYKGTPLHFRGHNVTTAQLNSIQLSHQLFSKATEIVVTGQSAGGLATFLWTNYIAARAPTAKVWSLPDSGIFLDSMDYASKQHSYRALFQNFMKISNEEVDPPTAECVAANPTEKWKCMFAEYISDHIKVPLFAIESMYDSWSLHYILGIACQANASLDKCDAGSRAYIEQYHANTSLALHRIAERKGNGYWAPSCSQHVYSASSSFNSAAFRIPANTTHSLAQSVTEWFTGKPVTYTHQDEGDWPVNKPCSGLPADNLAHSSLQHQ
jgi:O-palmitoleoyl-L-serine hydrolase